MRDPLRHSNSLSDEAERMILTRTWTGSRCMATKELRLVLAVARQVIVLGTLGGNWRSMTSITARMLPMVVARSAARVLEGKYEDEIYGNADLEVVRQCTYTVETLADSS